MDFRLRVSLKGSCRLGALLSKYLTKDVPGLICSQFNLILDLFTNIQSNLLDRMLRIFVCLEKI